MLGVATRFLATGAASAGAGRHARAHIAAIRSLGWIILWRHSPFRSNSRRKEREGKLKETEGEPTNDTMREKQGEAQQKWGEAKDKVDDMTDKDGDSN
jgi:uncharacterized protein YjbJ (UPF0337 family)